MLLKIWVKSADFTVLLILSDCLFQRAVGGCCNACWWQQKKEVVSQLKHLKTRRRGGAFYMAQHLGKWSIFFPEVLMLVAWGIFLSF